MVNRTRGKCSSRPPQIPRWRDRAMFWRLPRSGDTSVAVDDPVCDDSGVLVQKERSAMGATLNPYLSFTDNARQALQFYQGVLGGELTLNTFGAFGAEGPDAE